MISGPALSVRSMLRDGRTGKTKVALLPAETDPALTGSLPCFALDCTAGPSENSTDESHILVAARGSDRVVAAEVP
jgi:hypothetical protein